MKEKVRVGRNIYSREVHGKSRSVEEARWRDAFFLRELGACIFKLEDLQTSEVGTNLDKPHGRNWRSFLVSREFVDPLAS